MNCRDAQSKLPDLLQDGLAAADNERLQEHLRGCAACWQEWQELHETWSRLGLVAEEQPGPTLRLNFYRLLEAQQGAASARLPWRRRLLSLLPDPRAMAPALRLAAAVLVVALGFGTGFFLGRGGEDGARLRQLSDEVGRLRQQASISMLSQSSATARLQGVSLATRQPEPGPELLAKLLDILESDPSVNVRLQAVDALYLFAGRAEVRAALSGSLARQTSPQVQVALIDLLVSLREKQAAASLKKLIGDEKTLPEVQQRARAGIERIL